MNSTINSNTTISDLFLELFQKDYQANEIILIVLICLSVLFVLIALVECYNAFFLTCQTQQTKKRHGRTRYHEPTDEECQF